MTDIDFAALKAAAEKASKTAPGQWRDDGYRIYDSRENQNCIFEYKHEPRHTDDGDWDTYRFIALANPATVLALIERLERAEAVAEYARSREMPTTEKQVKAAEMFFTAPMMARLEKLEDLAKAARDLGLETVCIADPPCFNCRACRFHLALAVLEAP